MKRTMSKLKFYDSKIKYILIGVIILLFLPIVTTYGRYIYNDLRDFYLASKSFYFNSDKLTTERAIYQVDNWSAVDDYQIAINLNNSKNNLVHANSDIEYTIEYSCSSNVNCSIDKTGGTIYSGEISDSFLAVMSPNTTFEDGDEAWMEISASSTSPYKKKLSARFILKVGKVGLSYSIDDVSGRPYFNFRITNTLDYYLVKETFDNYSVGDRIDRLTYMNLSEENKAKCNSALITLTFDPSKVILDMTNTAYLNAESYTVTTIGGYDYVNSITFKMDSETSEDVKFYKADADTDYTYPFTTDESVVEFNYSV